VGKRAFAAPSMAVQVAVAAAQAARRQPLLRASTRRSSRCQPLAAGAGPPVAALPRAAGCRAPPRCRLSRLLAHGCRGARPRLPRSPAPPAAVLARALAAARAPVDHRARVLLCVPVSQTPRGPASPATGRHARRLRHHMR
jgi:hypothetical protein